MNNSFIRSTSVLVGTMVGVGIFGIPFVFSKSGFFVGLLFLIGVGIFTLILNFIYGEIILRTQSVHQLVGYTQLYLGAGFKRVILFSILLSTYGALLAYMIIAGDFLSNIISPFAQITPYSLSIWFFSIVSILVLMGHKIVARVEVILTALFISVVALIFIFGLPHINISNFNYTNLEFWFLPYGVMLFAFAGMAAIPIQRDILEGNEKYLKKSILYAVTLVGGLYLAFAVVVLGVSGESTSPDAINGLVESLGGKVTFLGALFGILAVSTSYIMLGTILSDVFRLDYGISKFKSWLMVVVLPFILFIGGLRNFVDVIAWAGAVGVGLESVILILIYIKSKSKGDRVPEYSLALPKWVLYLLMAVFSGGIAYSLFIS